MTQAQQAPAPLARIPSARPASAIESMAARLQVDPNKLFQSLAATAFAGATNEEMLALVVTANQYGLNPFLKQIYAFPKRGGGIVPIVGIDGWSTIVNAQENFDGCEFSYEDDDDGNPVSCTCTMYLKNREHPIKVTEYYEECYRKTEPWNQMRRRMLRHKAYMQAARYAFGLGGIYDEDEGRDIAGQIIASTGDGHTLAEESKPRAAAIVEKLKAQNSAPATGPGVQADGTGANMDAPAPIATWEDLKKNFGITAIIESDGIAVQRAVGDQFETLRPDGTFDLKFSAWTVQPNNPEQDQLAREMALKAAMAPARTVDAVSASSAQSTLNTEQPSTLQPPPATRRPGPKPPKA